MSRDGFGGFTSFGYTITLERYYACHHLVHPNWRDHRR